MEETLYVFHSGGILEGTKEWYDEILPENIATSYLDIVNGKHILANSEQILFYKEHPDYDLYHLYYMIPLTEEELIEKKNIENERIKNIREALYKAESDSIYMSFIKYSALGQDDKAKEAYDQWLAKVKQIEEENPYIE